MATFSEVIDELIVEIVRPDMIKMLPAYLNQTIREMFLDSQTNMPVFYDDMRQELLLQASGIDDTDGKFLWDIPIPTLFQKMEAVWYDSIARYVHERKPNMNLLRNQVDVFDRYYWYRSGYQIALAGLKNGNTVRLSWFEYVPSLVYQPPANRVVKFDPLTQSYVYDMTKAPPGTTQEQAWRLASNWILDRHKDTLTEGVRAKAYKRMADEFRAKLCYSQWQALRDGIQKTEGLTGEAAIINR